LLLSEALLCVFAATHLIPSQSVCLQFLLKKNRVVTRLYQEFRRAQDIQRQRLYSGVVDSHFPMDSRAFDANQHTQVCREPCWICSNNK
uniref:Uncharacterized protein n=2 Tax=Sinocyclocheilus TaxID=75365 RepID=A0A673IA66_9TELE